MQTERPIGLLLDAIRAGDLARLGELLDAGTRPIRARVGLKRTESPLVAAALASNPEAARLLLAHGAPVDELGTAGYTALQVACKQSDLSMAQLLLRHGARASFFTSRPSATAFAAFAGNHELVALLLHNGGRPEEVWRGGVTSALRLTYRVLAELAAATERLPKDIEQVIRAAKLADGADDSKGGQ